MQRIMKTLIGDFSSTTTGGLIGLPFPGARAPELGRLITPLVYSNATAVDGSHAAHAHHAQVHVL